MDERERERESGKRYVEKYFNDYEYNQISVVSDGRIINIIIISIIIIIIILLLVSGRRGGGGRGRKKASQKDVR